MLRNINNDDEEFYKNKCKQLQAENERLQAENEKLKEIILKREQTVREGIGCNYPSALELSVQLSRNTTIELEKQKAENEKLKNRNIELEAYFKVNEDFQKAWQELNSIHNDLQKVYQDEHCDNLKYKQALEEVREWLLKWQFDANIIKHTNEPLNKINEVLK